MSTPVVTHYMLKGIIVCGTVKQGGGYPTVNRRTSGSLSDVTCERCLRALNRLKETVGR